MALWKHNFIDLFLLKELRNLFSWYNCSFR